LILDSLLQPQITMVQGYKRNRGRTATKSHLRFGKILWVVSWHKDDISLEEQFI